MQDLQVLTNNKKKSRINEEGTGNSNYSKGCGERYVREQQSAKASNRHHRVANCHF